METKIGPLESKCKKCECDDTCSDYCVCLCTDDCDCFCGPADPFSSQLNLELDSIVAFRNFKDVSLNHLVDILNNSTSVQIELPQERIQESVTFEMIGFEFREVLDFLKLSYR